MRVRVHEMLCDMTHVWNAYSCILHRYQSSVASTQGPGSSRGPIRSNKTGTWIRHLLALATESWIQGFKDILHCSHSGRRFRCYYPPSPDCTDILEAACALHGDGVDVSPCILDHATPDLCTLLECMGLHLATRTWEYTASEWNGMEQPLNNATPHPFKQQPLARPLSWAETIITTGYQSGWRRRDPVQACRRCEATQQPQPNWVRHR